MREKCRRQGERWRRRKEVRGKERDMWDMERGRRGRD